MPPLQFQLALTGNFAAALGPVNRTLGETDRNLEKARRNVRAFESQLGGLQAGAGGFGFNLSALFQGGSLFTLDLAQAVHLAVDAVKALVGAMAELGKEIVKTAAEAQDLNLAVQLDVGERGAGAVQQLADSFANTRFDDDEIRRSLLPLLEQGVTDTALLDDLATAAADVAARRGQGAEGLRSALGAFQRIALKGEVDGRALRELAIGEAAFFQDLGQLLGVSTKRAEELSKAGKVKSETLLSVALNQVAQREGGTLGTASLAAGRTLGATLERLSNLPGNLLKQLADTPGLHRLQNVLDNFIEVLSGPEGERVMREIGNLLAFVAESLFSLVSGEGGLQRITFVVRSIAAGVRTFWEVMQAGSNATLAIVDGISDAYHAVARAIDNVVDAIGRSIDRTKDLFSGTLDRVRGLFVGDAVEEAREAGRALGEALPEGAQEGLDARSPSRKMMLLGAGASEGFALGVESGAGGVRSATRRAIVDTALGASGEGRLLAAPAAATTLSVPVEVNVYASGRDVEDLAQTVEQGVRVALRRAFDEIGYGLGAQGV